VESYPGVAGETAVSDAVLVAEGPTERLSDVGAAVLAAGRRTTLLAIEQHHRDHPDPCRESPDGGDAPAETARTLFSDGGLANP